jgi:hypothetical protein
MRYAFFPIVLLSTLAIPSAAGADGPAPRDCIQSWPEARMQAYGYNHIVHVRDVCDVPADCVITTDVNPEPTKVSVAAKSETEVNTFLGSPARVFTPKVACTLHTLK